MFALMDLLGLPLTTLAFLIVVLLIVYMKVENGGPISLLSKSQIKVKNKDVFDSCKRDQ